MGRASRAKRPAPQGLPAWTPFERGYLPPIDVEAHAAAVAADSGFTVAQVRDAVLAAQADVIWVNSRYQVNASRERMRGGPGVIHLSIKRRDKEPVGKERFRDFQRIKNELVGPEYEGAELYPADRRLVDSTNQYHIWVVDDPAYQFPFGFEQRLVLGVTPNMMGAKQEPLPEGYFTPTTIGESR